MSEAHRQRRVMQALGARRAQDVDIAALALHETRQRALDGVAAYLTNRDAGAQRALAQACPTVQALVGEQDFARLAGDFWCAHPPQRGDLGEWGAALPGWLAARPALASWPWLGDCAQLDLAVHGNERAADASMDVASLARLDADDGARCRLALMPGTALVSSPWPIAHLYEAHRSGPAGALQMSQQSLAALRTALHDGVGEHALVVREGWRAVVHSLDPATARFVRAVLDGACLRDAVHAGGSAFDFEHWLALAVGRLWMKGVIGADD